MALGYDGVIRIDTMINSSGFAKGLKDMSNNLEKEVRSSEKLLESLQKKREDAANAVQIKQSGLEEERSKLAALQKQLQQLRETAENVRLPEAARENAGTQIPQVQMQLDNQNSAISTLQREYDQIAASVEKYDREIASTASNLEVQRTQAKQAAEELAAAKEELADLGRSAQVSSQKTVELSHRLAELKERQKTLESAGLGLGFQEYDQNVQEIAGITAVLKQYQAQLQETSKQEAAGENKLMDTLGKIGDTFSGAAPDLSGLAGGWLDRLDTVKDGLKQAAGEAGEAWENLCAKLKENAAAVQKILAGIMENCAALAGKLWSAAKNMIPLVKNMNGFAKISESLQAKLEKLGSALKRALVFSAAYRGISMLRQELGAYLMVNQQFVSALAQIKGVLLTAFQPVYEAVVPALTVLMNALSRIIAAVSHFTAALFGTTAKKAQKNAEALYKEAHAMGAVGGAAKEAAKEAERAIASFDEFNILNFHHTDGGSGGGGSTAGMDIPDFDYVYDETQFDSWGQAFSAFLDRMLAGIPSLENAFQQFADWLNGFSKKLYEMLTFPGVAGKVERLGRELAAAFQKLVNWIDWFQLGQALGAGLHLALQLLTEFIYGFDWMQLGRKLAEFVNGLVREVDWYDFGRLLWAEFKIALETLAGFLLGLDMPQLAQAASRVVIGFFDEMQHTIQRIPWASIGQQIAAFLNHVDWYGAITSALSGIAAAVMALKALADGFVDSVQWSSIASRIYTAVNSAIGQVDWQGLGQTLGNVFIRAVTFLRDLIAGIDWYQIGADVGKFLIGIDWVGAVGGLANVIAEAIGAAIRAVRGFLDTVSPHIKEIACGIAEKINAFFRSVDWAEAGRVISDGLKAALDFALELMRNVDWNAIGQCIVTFLENIDWGGLLARWGELVGETMTAKLAMMNMDGIVDVGVHVAEGLLKGILDKLASIGQWLKEHLADPIINGVKDLFGIHSPSTVMAEIGENLVAGLLQGISETWNNIVTFFTEKAEGIKTILSQTWEAIRSTAQTAFENLKNSISAVWQNIQADAASRWGAVKETISEKVGSIKERVSEGFTSVKETITSKVSEAVEALKGRDWASVGKSMVDGILNGLHGIFDKLSSWASKVWNSVTSAFDGGGKNVRSSSSRASSYRMADAVPEGVSVYQLPKLANGAVIPPNQQFAAILGDQRSGINVETPLATIKQALSETMQEMGSTGGDIVIHLTNEMDGTVLTRKIIRIANDMTRSAGKPVLLY